MQATQLQRQSSAKRVAREVRPKPPAADVSPHREIGFADRSKAAVQLVPLQRMAIVGRAGDPFEQEADEVARKVAAGQPAERVSRRTEEISPAAAPEGAPPEVQGSDAAPLAPEAQAAADEAVRSPGPGQPMNAATRNTLEERMGADLTGVRMHEGESAQSHAAALGARAFTHGSDIWLGRGESQSDLALMAHEATHVLQQGGAVRRNGAGESAAGGSAGQVAGGADAGAESAQLPTGPVPTAPGAPATAGTGKTGAVDTTRRTITWDTLKVPRFKARAHRGRAYASFPGGLRRGRGPRVDREGDNEPAQRRKWLAEVSSEKILKDLQEKAKSAQPGEQISRTPPVFEVRTSKSQTRYYAGTIPSLAKEFTIPTWGTKQRNYRTAEPKLFHVDHIVELQLANWPHSTEGNALGNMELLEGRANQTSGRMVRSEIVSKLLEFNRATKGKYAPGEQGKDDVLRFLKTHYTLVFERVRGGGGPNVGRSDYWERSEIEQAEHMRPVYAASPASIGGQNTVRIFSREHGGLSKRFGWNDAPGEQPVTRREERNWLRPLVVTHKFFRTRAEDEGKEDFGYVKAHVPEDHPAFLPTEPATIPMTRFVGARYGGALAQSPRTIAREQFRSFEGLSPLSVDEVDILGETGLTVRGRIQPDVAALADNLYVDFLLQGGDLTLQREFTAPDIALPSPFSIDDAAILLAYSMRRGLSATGSVSFGIERVGQGSVSVGYGQESGLTFNGAFDFDSTLFRPASVEVSYANGRWGATGTIGFGRGALPGVRSGTLTVGWQEGVLSAGGEVELDVPGVQSGRMNMTYSEAEGFALGGVFQLNDGIVGLRSGEATLSISRGSEAAWSFGGGIAAELDVSRVPGVQQTRLTGSFRDGIFAAQLDAGYRRGPAGGTVTVGVTNQAVDEGGQPIEGQATPDIVFYGSGSLVLQLTPWLAADATVRFDRKGGVTLEGGVEVTEDIILISGESTPDFELPHSRRPGIDLTIPIVQLGVGDVAVDIGAEVNVFLRTSPLVLRDVRLGVFYDFDDPGATRIEGNARIHMDAEAGVSATGSIGLSARVLVLRGGGSINLTLGAVLRGDLDAVLRPRWSLREGFEADANLDVVVRPELFVALTGELYAEVDLLLGSLEVWRSDPLNIADRRLPVDLEVGARASASYREQRDPQLQLGGLTWVYPTTDQFSRALAQLARDLLG